jgi:hypothetical protein
MAKIKTVKLLLGKIIADRLQYKPYISELSSPIEHPIYVQIRIPEDEILEDGDDYTVITEAGLAQLMNKVATAVEDMHNEYIEKVKGRR